MDVARAPDPIREPTRAEVEAFSENGWVQLEGLLTPETAAGILSRVQSRMGADATAEVRGDYSAAGAPETLQRAWRNYDSPSSDDEWVHSVCFSDGLSRVTTRLMGDRDARFLADSVLCKLPAAMAGGRTPWHNDLMTFPLDRAGSLTIWIALVGCPPEKGTLRYLSGSHRERPLGRYAQRDDGIDMVGDHPWLTERYEECPPLHLRAGDALVHDMMTVHSARVNTTDAPRWVYATHRFPADALYTGAPQRFFDGLGLALNQPVDHPSFPLLRA